MYFNFEARSMLSFVTGTPKLTSKQSASGNSFLMSSLSLGTKTFFEVSLSILPQYESPSDDWSIPMSKILLNFICTRIYTTFEARVRVLQVYQYTHTTLFLGNQNLLELE